MQILIEIPEGTKLAIDMGRINQVLTYNVWTAIQNGTPLPEHHGDLVDKKEVYKKFYSRCLAEVATEVLSEVTTIIPATKEGTT